MANLAEARYNIQQEEVAYKAAISESVATRIGKALNFVNVRQHDVKEFRVNGPYETAVTPVTPLFETPQKMQSGNSSKVGVTLLLV